MAQYIIPISPIQKLYVLGGANWFYFAVFSAYHGLPPPPPLPVVVAVTVDDEVPPAMVMVPVSSASRSVSSLYDTCTLTELSQVQRIQKLKDFFAKLKETSLPTVARINSHYSFC